MHDKPSVLYFSKLFRKVKAIVVIAILIYPKSQFAQNCAAPSTGFTPINDLETGTFTNAWNQIWTGGLYPEGSNVLPMAHKIAGQQMASQVQPLDTNGNPDEANGKIVWLSIGMSNTTQETQQFIRLANADPDKNPKLILVDGAQGGQSASRISAPWNAGYLNFWNTVNARLSNAGVNARQVQVIWFKEADQATNYPGGIRPHYDSLVVMFKRIMNDIKFRFPNAKLCYMASRISARYATTNLNPEPFAYYTGWAVKKVIEDQIQGDPQLRFSGSTPNSPWLCWGIYMWSDGSTPQRTNPDVFWSCPTDFNADGTHPSTAGAQKVGKLLLDFYKNDTLSCPWFFNKPASICTITSSEDETDINESIEIYPNPFSVRAEVQSKNVLKNGTLVIYDILGQTVVLDKNINGHNYILERKNLPDGIYLITLFQGNSLLFRQKIIIQN